MAAVVVAASRVTVVVGVVAAASRATGMTRSSLPKIWVVASGTKVVEVITMLSARIPMEAINSNSLTKTPTITNKDTANRITNLIVEEIVEAGITSACMAKTLAVVVMMAITTTRVAVVVAMVVTKVVVVVVVVSIISTTTKATSNSIVEVEVDGEAEVDGAVDAIDELYVI